MHNKGYCIKCKKNIQLDINQPFCTECKGKIDDLTLKSKISGDFCHHCGKKYQLNNYNPSCNYCTPFDRKSSTINEIYHLKLQKYITLSGNDQLIINPIWNTDQIKYYSLKEFDILTILKITQLDKTFDIENILENSITSNKRIMNVLTLWENNQALQAPKIDFDDNPSFDDGRHRTLAAFYLGSKKLPVFCANFKDN